MKEFWNTVAVMINIGSVSLFLLSFNKPYNVAGCFGVCRNPGGTPEWLGNVVVAVVIATFVSLTMVYLLAYIHLSGNAPSQPFVLETYHNN